MAQLLEHILHSICRMSQVRVPPEAALCSPERCSFSSGVVVFLCPVAMTDVHVHVYVQYMCVHVRVQVTGVAGGGGCRCLSVLF